MHVRRGHAPGWEVAWLFKNRFCPWRVYDEVWKQGEYKDFIAGPASSHVWRDRDDQLMDVEREKRQTSNGTKQALADRIAPLPDIEEWVNKATGGAVKLNFGQAFPADLAAATPVKAGAAQDRMDAHQSPPPCSPCHLQGIALSSLGVTAIVPVGSATPVPGVSGGGASRRLKGKTSPLAAALFDCGLSPAPKKPTSPDEDLVGLDDSASNVGDDCTL